MYWQGRLNSVSVVGAGNSGHAMNGEIDGGEPGPEDVPLFFMFSRFRALM